MSRAPAKRTTEQMLVASVDPVAAAEAKRAPLDWGIARWLWTYMTRHPRLQTAIIAYAVVLALINAAVPVAVTETIRWTIETPQRWRDATGLSPGAGLAIGTGLCALLALLYYVVMALRIAAINVLAERVVYDIRHDVFTHIQRLHMRYFDRTKLGRILSRATSDVGALRSAVAEVIPRTLIHGLMMVFMGAMMVWYDWVLALLVLVLVPPLFFADRVLRRRMGDAYRVVQESFSLLTANIAESVAGMRVTQAFERQRRNASLFRDLCNRHRGRNMTAAHVHGIYIPLYEFAGTIVAALVLGVGVWRVTEGDAQVSDLIGFLLLTGGFFASVMVLAELNNTTLQAMAGGERITALLATDPEVADDPDAKPLPRTDRGARVAFEHVTFGYDPDRPVLHDVSFTAEPGTTVALVGRTGAGKSSIINLVCRFYEHQSGRVLIDGRDTREITLASLHRQTGLVLQDNFLFHGSVRDNIRFAKPEASDEEVRAACDALDCLDLLESTLPRGLDTEVGERGSNLSSGQAQLVCFARAMLADPRVLMLDEATSSVDTFTEHQVQTALERLMAGRTCLVVAHRLSTIRRADTILVLEHGRILERGTHRQLLDKGGRYATLHEHFVRLDVGPVADGDTPG